MHVQSSLWAQVFSPSVSVLGSTVAGLYSTSMFRIMRDCRTVLQSSCTILHCQHQVMRVSVAPHFCQHLVVPAFWIWHSNRVLQRARTNRIYVYIEREFIRENWLTRSSGEVPPQAIYKLRKEEASHVSKSESLKSWEANGQPSVCVRRPKSPQQTTGRSSGVQRPKNLESNVQGQEASTTGER